MTLRREVTEARRVVVKVGSSSLTTAAGGIDPDRVRALVDVLAAARERGVEVVLVSSGAIAAGLAQRQQVARIHRVAVEVLAHQAHRLGLGVLEFRRRRDRVPIAAHQFAHGRLGAHLHQPLIAIFFEHRPAP